MSDDWYVRIGPKTLGPLTEVEVRHVLDAGRISADTPVRKGANGPWIPAGQALAGGKGHRAPTPTKKRPAWLVAAATGAGLAVLIAGAWFAFGRGRRAAQPVAATAPPPADTNDASAAASVAVATPPAAVTPAVETHTTPAVDEPAVKPRPAVVAQRPKAKPSTPSTASGGKATVAGVEPSGKSAPTKAAVSQPKSVEPAANSKAPIVKVAPVVASAPATRAELEALGIAAQRSSTAKDALALYQVFGATRTISPAIEAVFQANLREWESRADRGAVRLGDQWVAAADAARAREEAARFCQQAYELTRVLKFDDAERSLDWASRVDPNSIAADFSAGILRSIAPAKYRSHQRAAKHFETVLSRAPGYVPALNNLALLEIREEKYAEAIGHLREAAERAPVPDEVAQNLARFVGESQVGRIHPTQPVLSEATDLYARVVNAKGRAATDRPKHGWRYMALVLPNEERKGLSTLETPAAESATFVRGTGLVVEPHYVLACRHVVDDLRLGRADKIELVDPTDLGHERRLPATCVAVDEANDLCLLRCDGLNVPPIALAETLPQRGSEALLLDLSGGSASRPGLKITLGNVTALPGEVARSAGPPWLDFSRQLWCDAAWGRASGGAFCDDRGNIVAIPSTSYATSNASGVSAVGKNGSNSTYVGGVPAPSARIFVRASLPAFAHPPVGGPAINWSKVEAKVSPSLILVATGYRKVVMVMSGKADASGLAQGAREAEADAYDDRCCTVCNGLARVRCHAPNCPFAAMHDEGVDPAAASTTKPSGRRMCPACLGTGTVRCPHCSIGIDPLLR